MKGTKLYTLNGWIVNYISIKLLQKSKTPPTTTSAPEQSKNNCLSNLQTSQHSQLMCSSPASVAMLPTWLFPNPKHTLASGVLSCSSLSWNDLSFHSHLASSLPFTSLRFLFRSPPLWGVFPTVILSPLPAFSFFMHLSLTLSIWLFVP